MNPYTQKWGTVERFVDGHVVDRLHGKPFEDDEEIEVSWPDGTRMVAKAIVVDSMYGQRKRRKALLRIDLFGARGVRIPADTTGLHLRRKKID